jgi:beta-lactamase superfamily II metal-dependent hydrolase
MDVLLKGSSFGFSVDEIFYNEEKKLFGATIIPDIDSEFFPPWHLRTIYFKPDFLIEEFFNSYKTKLTEIPSESVINFQSTIEQGSFYDIPTDNFPNKKIPLELTNDYHDIFKQHKIQSPYEYNPVGDIMNIEQGLQDISEKNHKEKKLFLYCFNVGQGDSFLLIFPNENVFLIDTNIYSSKSRNHNSLERYILNIKKILKKHKLCINTIKGLLITHKHLDHIRGASNLIDSDEFKFEYFLLNYDYKHPTRIVKDLIDSANKKIKNRININNKGTFFEGKVEIEINNPGPNTKNEKVCKDINDSSISLLIKYDNSTIALTGDTGFHLLNHSYSTSTMLNKGNNILKVSHHGSRTGTDLALINTLAPKYAYISAGSHKGFNHPHDKVENLFIDKNIPYDVSKNVFYTVRYELSSHDILKRRILML